METHNFEYNGLEYKIEKSVSGDYCYLTYNGIVIYNDSACEDFYGEPDELEDVFKAYIQEEASKQFPWWRMMYAIVEQGSDPSYIEDEEEARSWSETINKGRVWRIEDEQDFETAKVQLGFEEDDDVDRIFAFVNGNRGNFVLNTDF